MNLFGLEIRRAGAPQQAPDAPESLRKLWDALEDAQRRIRALEDDQASRELRLGKLADDIRRHFKRVQELDRRERTAPAGEDDELDEMLAQMRAANGRR